MIIDHNDDRIFRATHHYSNECLNVLNFENMPLIRHSCVLGILYFWNTSHQRIMHHHASAVQGANDVSFRFFFFA